MAEFFKSWRRKVGVMTLLIACLCLGGWVRSLNTIDLIFVRGGLIVVSLRGNFSFSHRVHVLSQTLSGGFPSKIRSSDFREGLKIWSMDASSTITIQTDHAMIPYWSLVLPATALSAYLLLTKPRESTRKKVAEPAITEERSALPRFSEDASIE